MLITLGLVSTRVGLLVPPTDKERHYWGHLMDPMEIRGCNTAVYRNIRESHNDDNREVKKSTDRSNWVEEA